VSRSSGYFDEIFDQADSGRERISGANAYACAVARGVSSAVQLKPMTERDIDLLAEDLRSEDGTGSYQWFGFTPALDVRRKLGETGLLGKDGGMLSAVAGETVVGRVEWFAAAWGRPSTSACWTIAVAIRPQERGRGFGTQAHRLLVDYLFRHTRAERIQAYTDAENAAEQRALEKSGFRREGVLYSAQWRDGGWRDQVLYSVIRSGTRLGEESHS
jgi:RimJ/RimL family protein N-acetyltransferase